MVNVRLDVIPGPQAIRASGAEGITKFTWYSPTEPGVSPANAGVNGHIGVVEQAVMKTEAAVTF
jgi:hypothetical protein